MEDNQTAIDELKTLLNSPKSTVPEIAKALSNAHYDLAEYLFEARCDAEAIAESRKRLEELRAADSPDEKEIRGATEQLARFEAGRDGDRN